MGLLFLWCPCGPEAKSTVHMKGVIARDAERAAHVRHSSVLSLLARSTDFDGNNASVRAGQRLLVMVQRYVATVPQYGPLLYTCYFARPWIGVRGRVGIVPLDAVVLHSSSVLPPQLCSFLLRSP